MTEEEQLHDIVRRELGNRGYIVSVNAHREGEIVVGRLQVTAAETDEPVARLVGVANVDDVRMCFGIDAGGTMRDALVKMLGVWEGMQGLLPTFVVKTPKA